MNFPLSLIALASGLGIVWLIAPWRHLGLTHFIPYAAIIPCLAIVLVISVIEWVRPGLRAPSAGVLARHALRPLDLSRVGVRLCGFVATLALVAFVYWLLPEYSGSF